MSRPTRVLVVSESPPSLDPAHGNGATLILGKVLPRLDSATELDLVYYDDRPVGPERDVVDRCRTVRRLPTRPAPVALVGQVMTRLPKATWQRDTSAARDLIGALEVDADVVYLHGLHTFSLANRRRVPVVANEIDPLSVFWSQVAARAPAPQRLYYALQARRAARLEQVTGERVSAYVVVNREDALGLQQRLGRRVTAIPNGVEFPSAVRRDASGVQTDTVAFVGSLDYAPNIEAVERLISRVFPLVRRRHRDARLLIAGRKPAPALLDMRLEGIEVLGEVERVEDVFATSAVAVSPGLTGTGTKNTVIEALAAGCPVVASPEAARGLGENSPVVRAGSDEALASEIVALMLDPERRELVGAEGPRFVSQLPDWDEVAERFSALFSQAASHG
ncbi:MAG: hypothetical protein JJLCMIEE_00847 [Acidimicrobiales bacterium]|nr:MAG: glycosyltransferase [Actinomycetota bacterium]MBV6507789.1 hypothetical protein [Acidimicrobiales bacterium]RIK05946.1 MAG: hypothetical protein DCC48_08280 [Acidobacteriota bacterium]